MPEDIVGTKENGLLNATTALPEPRPPSRNEQAEARIEKFINNFPRYPEDCVINGAGFFNEQAIHFKRSDIGEDVSGTQALQQEYERGNISFDELMSRTIGNLRARYKGDPEKWAREYVNRGMDRNATITDVRENECASCFHLNLVFSDLMHNIGVDAKVIQGSWVETSRQRVIGSYDLDKVKLARQFVKDGVYILEGEKSEDHAFTLIEKEGKYWLADAALWIKDDSGEPIEPVVCEVSKETLLSRDIRVPLPNGKYRHYVFNYGAINELEIEGQD